MILNRNILKNVIEELKSPFKNIELSKEEKTITMFLNSSLFKAKLAKKEPYQEIVVKQKDINSLIFPNLTEEDTKFYALLYDYLYFITKKEERIIEYFENTHIVNTLLESLNYLVLEHVYVKDLDKIESSKLSFREYFDRDISKYGIDKEDVYPEEFGYLQEIYEDNAEELIIKMYNKRTAVYDKVRNNMMLCEIELRDFLRDNKFFDYKYTKYKR